MIKKEHTAKLLINSEQLKVQNRDAVRPRTLRNVCVDIWNIDVCWLNWHSSQCQLLATQHC